MTAQRFDPNKAQNHVDVGFLNAVTLHIETTLLMRIRPNADRETVRASTPLD